MKIVNTLQPGLPTINRKIRIPIYLSTAIGNAVPSNTRRYAERSALTAVRVVLYK